MSESRYSFSPRATGGFTGSDLDVTDNESGQSIRISRRDNMLTVDVRDPNIRSTYPVAVQNALDVVDESAVEAIYQGVQEDFWRLMDERAKALGFPAAYSAGHSSGWLAVDGTQNWDPETLTNPGLEDVPQRDNFLLLAFEADAAVGEHIQHFGELVIVAARVEENALACPNCGRTFKALNGPEHTESGCFLGMLVGVLQDRDVGVTHADVAGFQGVDGLWDSYGGPAADELERALNDPVERAITLLSAAGLAVEHYHTGGGVCCARVDRADEGAVGVFDGEDGAEDDHSAEPFVVVMLDHPDDEKPGTYCGPDALVEIVKAKLK